MYIIAAWEVLVLVAGIISLIIIVFLYTPFMETVLELFSQQMETSLQAQEHTFMEQYYLFVICPIDVRTLLSV